MEPFARFVIMTKTTVESGSSDIWIGVFATLLAVIVTLMGTRYFQWRDEVKKHNAIWYAVREEVTTNYVLADRWISYIKNEVEAIENNGTIVQPIEPFQTNFFDIIKQQIPNKLKKDVNLLNELRLISQIINSLNTYNNSRELYKINNPAFSNYKAVIKIYDNSILNLLTNLKEKIESNYSELIIVDEKHRKELRNL